MRKTFFGAIGMAVLFGALFVPGGIGDASAEVSVSINLGPPPIVVAEPPAMVLVPRTQIYFVPGRDIDVFFYAGYWWSPRGDRWYRARAYNGPWGVVDRRYVPSSVRRVPKDYRVRFEREKHVPYGQWKKHHVKEERRDRKEVRKEMKEHDKGKGGHDRDRKGHDNDRGDRDRENRHDR